MKNPKIPEIYSSLHDHFGYQNWWPIVESGRSLYLPEFRSRERSFEEAFEIAIGALLTQNTAWTNVEKALFALRRENLLNFHSLSCLNRDDLAAKIRPAGYFNQKARKIHALCRFIESEFNGDFFSLKSLSVLEAREKLLNVWGIGKETADSILLYGLGMPIFVVDAYTRRIFSRLGICDEKADYDEMRLLIEDSIDRDLVLYQEYHAQIVKQAVTFCSKKPKCSGCPIAFLCLFEK